MWGSRFSALSIDGSRAISPFALCLWGNLEHGLRCLVPSVRDSSALAEYNDSVTDDRSKLVPPIMNDHSTRDVLRTADDCTKKLKEHPEPSDCHRKF